MQLFLFLYQRKEGDNRERGEREERGGGDTKSALIVSLNAIEEGFGEAGEDNERG